MIRNLLAALGYYGEGLALVPVALWALVPFGVLALVLELAAARRATLRNRALGEGQLLDGSRYARATLEGSAGAYVRLGTSIEQGKTASIEPTLAAEETRWQCDDGSVLLVPPGTKLRVAAAIPEARRTLERSAGRDNNGHTYDFAIPAGTALWLRGPLPESASPVHDGVHRASAQRVVSTEAVLIATVSKPPAQGEGFGCGCAAVPLLLLPALFVAGVREHGAGTMAYAGVAGALVLWRLLDALGRLAR